MHKGIATGWPVLAILACGHADAKATAALPAAVILDCKSCPEMIVIGPGEFAMGRPVRSDLSLPEDEPPPTPDQVRRRFAMSRTEITVGQFLAFVGATGRKPGNSCFGWTPMRNGKILEGADWNAPGFVQTRSQPVVCVTLA